MNNDFDKLIASNDDYQKNKKRNIFLYHSYMGGDVYKTGEYLTKYINESETDYEERVKVTPLDNHCSGVIGLYNSFLFRQTAHRDWGSLVNDPSIPAFVNDADLEGRSLNSFIKDVNTYAGIFGMTWVVVSKPNVNAGTRAEELAQDVRPYLSVVSPLMMLDWEYTRSASGHYRLTYVKYVEESSQASQVIKEWYPEVIVTSYVDMDKREVTRSEREVNGIGVVPVVPVYSSRSHKRGVGISLINDISDLQRAIYNEYSEIEQNIRLSGHPSLVKTPGTEAGAGPGAIIQMEENMDSGLKPYLLQPSGASVDSLYTSIQHKVEAIDRIAHLGAIRETAGRTMSGVSRSMEFEQLNARLSEIADNLELAEEQIMRFYSVYQGTSWDGVVEYPESFNIRDTNSDLSFYITAISAPVSSSAYRREVELAIVKTVLGSDTEKLQEIEAEIASEFTPHLMVNLSGDTLTATSLAVHQQLTAAGYKEL